MNEALELKEKLDLLVKDARELKGSPADRLRELRRKYADLAPGALEYMSILALVVWEPTEPGRPPGP